MVNFFIIIILVNSDYGSVLCYSLGFLANFYRICENFALNSMEFGHFGLILHFSLAYSGQIIRNQILCCFDVSGKILKNIAILAYHLAFSGKILRNLVGLVKLMLSYGEFNLGSYRYMFSLA